MDNYLMIDGKKIQISDETAKNLKKQFKEKKYFACGDVFQDYAGDNCILCYGYEQFMMFDLESGNHWGKAYKDDNYEVDGVPTEVIDDLFGGRSWTYVGHFIEVFQEKEK